MTKQQEFTDALNEPAARVGTLTTGVSPHARLQMAMRMANNDDPTDVPEPTSYSNDRLGVPNPYGSGLKAFEPNNVIFQAFQQAQDEVDASKAADAVAAPGATLTQPGPAVPGVNSTFGNATGKVGTAIQKALDLATRRVPYVWGGTSANGVDCSGLIYYAFNAAGIKIPRYRAVDYGHMGVAVSVDQARPGDIIYYDEPGATDHVGIYLGGGQMVQAPTTGQTVKISSIGKPTSIRRIFDDDQFGQIATPTGSVTSYGGRVYQPNARAAANQALNSLIPGANFGGLITTPTTIGRSRPI